MAILTFKSENPNFSYILQKNPEGGMIMKSYRKGVVFGYYAKDGSYVGYFKDGDDEMSLSKGNGDGESFEYNDTSRYNSPLSILAIMRTLFRSVIGDKVLEHDVEGFEHTIVVNMMYVYNTKYFDILGRYLQGYDVELTPLSNKNYQVTIKSKKTVRETFAFLYAIGVIYYCRTDEPWLEEEVIALYIKILNIINPPYFLKYVFKSNLLQSQGKFNAVKELLDKNNFGEVWDIKLGNTHSQRRDFILSEITGEFPIIDLGCGEMTSYGFRLARILGKNNDELRYHAIDKDTEITDILNKKIASRGIENISVYNDFVDFIDCEYEGKFDIIMSEIFEHVELKQDTKWIKDIVKSIDFNKIIITTPNKDFNNNYLFEDDDMRLDSHIFEMTKTEFENYFNSLLPKLGKLEWSFVGIGDSVNGIHATQAVIINKK